MESIDIRTLRSADAKALLDFELENRAWFERSITPRDPAFYSLQGVSEHISDYLTRYTAGTWHSCVIEDARGVIIGRANLKDIGLSGRSAEVGYRIAQDVCGKGLATLAVKHLIEQAQSRWHLNQLSAQVYAYNIGSAKVLERCGFVLEQVTQKNGDDHEYRFVLRV
ncbi:GNAT family N-acetyltransferase [Pseudomonas huanghezhanensis]|uniref:GNAT family N-acetyltransferase n=1 Tax=Pseudomonas huanghezhanensis TaxID=3002903 RepID=UPI002285CECC|nr:GNAT family protein [Pseudomonas sp. BSw22131]